MVYNTPYKEKRGELMKQSIVVIDGMGGGIGVQLIGKLKDLDADIVALGTNSTATEKMLRAGAQRGATGENAIRLNVRLADFIMGPMGIVIPGGLMGEISAPVAEAVMTAPGRRILIPLQDHHFHLVGQETQPLARLVDKALTWLKEQLPRERSEE
jgi:hypothetical protein